MSELSFCFRRLANQMRTGRKRPFQSQRSIRKAKVRGMSDNELRALAISTFGDEAKADKWLCQPLFILGGATPLDFAKEPHGREKIKTILAKIDWGAAA